MVIGDLFLVFYPSRFLFRSRLFATLATTFKEGRGEMVEEVENKAKNRKRKEAYIYGNYKFYYGYRIDRNLKEDPRLMVFRKEWFKDKDCLDIGCNQGLVTIDIAKKFFCQSMLGIDIDASLVETAVWNLQKIAKAGHHNSRMKDPSESELSNGGFVTKQNSQSSIEGNVNFNASPPKEWNLLERVSFQTKNIVKNLNECSEKYDTILCLSVAKWVHLNWGDDGLITLFAKVWRLLRPGGIFVLEPQPWDSYKKNRRVSETARLNFLEIMFPPDLFEEILLDKIGFRSVENITGNLSGIVTGFERPIYVFRK